MKIYTLGMVNGLLGERKIVPELIQVYFTPEPAVRVVATLLTDENARTRMILGDPRREGVSLAAPVLFAAPPKQRGASRCGAAAGLYPWGTQAANGDPRLHHRKKTQTLSLEGEG